MFNWLKGYGQGRRLGLAAVTTIGISFLLAGFLWASAQKPANNSITGVTAQGAQATGAVPTIPASFADLAKNLGPSVVNIRVTKVEKVAGPGWPIPGGPNDEFFKHFFQEMPQHPKSFRMQGAGSGFIFSRGGYILTNNHVVEGAQEVTVTLSDRQEYKAKVVGRDPKTDLAVLKIDPRESLPVVALGDSDQLRVGDWVLAIGNPFGLSNTVTSGIVSAKGRVIGAGPYDDFIQTDAPINPGNSGGPLFNLKGEVVGINTAIVPNGQGIGFAIPIDIAKPLIPQLVSKGEVTRGYLGVSVQSLTLELAKSLKAENAKGALVGDVVAGSPAEKAGIHRGDVIEALNKEKVEGPQELALLVAKTQVGQKVTVTILREGVQKEIPVTIEKLGSTGAKTEASIPTNQGKWGLGLRDRSTAEASQKGDRGVVVANVQPGSPADQAGVRQGDIILEINRKPVNSVGEAKGLISQAGEKDSLMLLLKRDQGTFFVALAK